MRNFFYYPDRNKYDSPDRLGLAYESVQFKSKDQTQLTGWFIPALGCKPLDAKGTIVHMHGNAQNMTAHWAFGQWIPERQYNLFVFDYRGYGQSQGSPDEQGLFEDSVAALDYIRSRTDIDTEKLFVFGQSLGGMLAIAAAAASPRGINAVCAEAPVLSYSEWAFDMMPEQDIPTDDTYCASSFIKQLSPVRLMLMHGTADKVVPYAHSTQLLKEAGEPKQLVTIEGGGHNEAMTSIYGSTYQNLMIDFFASSTD